MRDALLAPYRIVQEDRWKELAGSFSPMADFTDETQSPRGIQSTGTGKLDSPPQLPFPLPVSPPQEKGLPPPSCSNTDLGMVLFPTRPALHPLLSTLCLEAELERPHQWATSAVWFSANRVTLQEITGAGKEGRGVSGFTPQLPACKRASQNPGLAGPSMEGHCSF